MKTIVLNDTFFVGAASIEHTDHGLKPWRLPHYDRDLYPSPNDGLMSAASNSSGVRLRFATNSTELGLCFQPLREPQAVIPSGHCFDLVIDNEILDIQKGMHGTTEISFDNVPDGDKICEIWLPSSCPVELSSLLVSDNASVQALPDRRPLWVTWGSSLTHCVRSDSAANIWPAIVSRRHDLNLFNLGFGGQCHLDPMVAMYIRDLPADFISLKLGINTIGGSVNARTYPALVTAAVKIIREKHPHTPMALISPIAYPPNESTPNAVNYTIEGMRHDMEQVYQRLVKAGDMNLYYINGLDLFNVEDIQTYSEDQCHPKGDGIALQAERFSQHVIPLLMGKI